MEAGPKYVDTLNLDFGCHTGCVQGLIRTRTAMTLFPRGGQWSLRTESKKAPKAWIVVMREVHALSASQSKDTIQESLLNTLPR